MVFIKKGKQGRWDELARTIAGDFFHSSSEVAMKKYPDAYNTMRVNTNFIREVFRHSLCLALGLQSVSALSDMWDLEEFYAKCMRDIIGDSSSWSIEQKQGVLQASMHYVMFATKTQEMKLNEKSIQK